MEKIVVICDFCGSEGEYSDFYDGGSLIWRPSEEDGLSVFFKHVCDECYETGDVMIELDDIFLKLRELAPFADVALGPARRASEQ